MDGNVQAQLDRVDAALTTLIDSISSYQPSPSAALSLVEADNGLSASLSLLAHHQQQYARLQYLRGVEDELSSRVKANLTLLARTRRDLLHDTPVRMPDPNASQVDFETLLSYAQRIAKQTDPSNKQEPDTVSPATIDEVPNLKIEDGDQELLPNGNTPAREANEVAQDGLASSKAADALPEAEKAYLRQDVELAFVPWPPQDVIRRGALQRIQEAVEGGQDPGMLDLSQRATAEAHDDSTGNEQGAPDARRPQDERMLHESQPSQVQRQPTAPQTADFDEFDLYDPTQG